MAQWLLVVPPLKTTAGDAPPLPGLTADHGEYCSSHGLRGKAASVYEESIHVPLYVKGISSHFTAQPKSGYSLLVSRALCYTARQHIR